MRSSSAATSPRAGPVCPSPSLPWDPAHDANGQATFQTVYPGWYQGRITHVHFQVYLDSGLVATSQIAFPPEVTDAEYAVEPYAAKGRPLACSDLEEEDSKVSPGPALRHVPGSETPDPTHLSVTSDREQDVDEVSQANVWVDCYGQVNRW
jgi:hypothetical protein